VVGVEEAELAGLELLGVRRVHGRPRDLADRAGEVVLDHEDLLVRPFDDHAALAGHHAQHAAALAAVAARDDDHVVVLADGVHHGFHQSTSGASEMIFMNRFSRSSRATGPNTRVPMGSPSGLMRTAAFRSNRM